MLTGNKGEWSEPYVLIKLISEGKLYLGDEKFEKVSDFFYPILTVIRHEQNRDVKFNYQDKLVIISDDQILIEKPIIDFVTNAKLCIEKIINSKSGKGSFEIPEIENFLKSINISSLKAKSKLKNDITIQIEDYNTFLTPTLGFSVKSQLGRPSTLVNASGATNFTYLIEGKVLTDNEINEINGMRLFSKKIEALKRFGVSLKFEKVDNEVFKSNLQTIDFNFDKILSEILILYYSNDNPLENTVSKFIDKITSKNTFDYNLEINSSIYELIIKKFLIDYALGMRAAEVWKREYQATGGYLIVKDDGELICYHFYFAKFFEDYLFKNTKLETPDPKRHKFGNVYLEDNVQKFKLNLQIRFIK